MGSINDVLKEPWTTFLEEWINENPYIEQIEWSDSEMISFAMFCVEKMS